MVADNYMYIPTKGVTVEFVAFLQINQLRLELEYSETIEKWIATVSGVNGALVEISNGNLLTSVCGHGNTRYDAINSFVQKVNMFWFRGYSNIAISCDGKRTNRDLFKLKNSLPEEGWERLLGFGDGIVL